MGIPAVRMRLHPGATCGAAPGGIRHQCELPRRRVSRRHCRRTSLCGPGHRSPRGFKALKVWLSFLAHGSDRYARLIEQNVAQARYLTQLVEADPDLQLLAPTALNIVCFRY